jgi:prophage regulatory protein
MFLSHIPPWPAMLSCPLAVPSEHRDAPFTRSITMQIERLLVSKKELKTIGIPYSPQHIARLERAKLFPQRIILGQCRVAWCYGEICEWIAERIARRDAANKADE